MKLHGSVQSGVFLLAKSEGLFARPDIWMTCTWYLLTTDRKVVTRGLTENSPRQSLSKPWTQGSLSVNTLACSRDCIIKGLKCLTLAAIENASFSHGNHKAWCFLSFALKKPVSNICPFRFTYKVAPIPCFVTEPSVIIQNWSFRLGKTLDLRESESGALCAHLNCSLTKEALYSYCKY